MFGYIELVLDFNTIVIDTTPVTELNVLLN
jgi:hypothetical protein